MHITNVFSITTYMKIYKTFQLGTFIFKLRNYLPRVTQSYTSAIGYNSELYFYPRKYRSDVFV